MERLHQIKGAAALACQLSHEDGVNTPVLGEGHDLLPLWALVLGAGGNLLPNSFNLVASPLSESQEVPFLSFTGLVRGGNPAVDGHPLSQLNLSDFEAGKRSPSLSTEVYHSAISLNGTTERRMANDRAQAWGDATPGDQSRRERCGLIMAGTSNGT